MARRRSARALHDTIRDLEAIAASFGAHQVAAFFADAGPNEQILEPGELDALSTAARLAAGRFATFDELEQRIAVVQRNRRFTPATPRAAIAPEPAKARATPTGKALQDLLATGLAGLSTLETEPLMEPIPVEDEVVVPIDDLLYVGDAALIRAIELRDALRSGGAAPDDALPELFDLLDLARSR
jgi:hypothetical protein